MKQFLRLLRVSHYLKNGLILLPLFFGKQLFNYYLSLKSIIGFVIFSLAASMVYIFNDICDAGKDKLHSSKKNRPIATGDISLKIAISIILILGICALILNYIFFNTFFIDWWLIIYIVINIAYSIKLKNIPIIDVSFLAFGFLLRVLYGSSITGIEVSNWLYLTVLAMSFYMGFGKRRNELQAYQDYTRKALKHYTQSFLDKNMYVCVTLTVVFYSLWCIDMSGNIPYIMFTIPLVMLICMKYNLDIEIVSDGDPISTLLSDKWLLTLVSIYIATVISLIYVF